MKKEHEETMDFVAERLAELFWRQWLGKKRRKEKPDRMVIKSPEEWFFLCRFRQNCLQFVDLIETFSHGFPILYVFEERYNICRSTQP